MSDIALFRIGDDDVVEFGMSNIERVVKGPEAALNVVIYHLYTTPGANRFNVNEGGGLRKLLAGHVKSREEITTDVSIIISQALASIRRSQSRDLSPDMTIADLRLLGVQTLPETAEIRIKIMVVLADGNSFQFKTRVS